MIGIVSAALAAAVAVSPRYEGGNCQAPRWSPDGGALAWEVNYHEQKVIHLYVSSRGGAARRFTPPDAGASRTAGFAGAPDVSAHELSFAPGALGRFVYAAGSGDFDLRLDSGAALAPSPGADGGAAWSPDGRHIAFTSARTGQGDLYLLDTGAIDAAPRRISGEERSAELFPAWSPDGRKLAFVGRTAQGDNLWIIDDVAFPAPRAITAWPNVSTRPTWSPDGTKIAFFSNHRDAARVDLYVMTVGGTPTLVAAGVAAGARGPSWSPDGRHLLYVKDDPQALDPVWAAPVADPTRAAAVATDTVGNSDVDVVLKPDGSTWLAVAAIGLTGDAVRDFRRIYVMRLPTLP